MNCQEALSELVTGSLRDMRADSAVMQHCAICPDCGPLATALRDREYNAASVLNNLPPMSSPIAVAERAGELARRRRIGKVAVFASGAALVVTMWTALFVTGFGRAMLGIDHSSLRTETIPLTCLSPQQAADIINPYVRSNGSTFYIGESGVAAITVRGTPAELAKSHELIRRFDSDPNACRTSLADKLQGLEKLQELTQLKELNKLQNLQKELQPLSERANAGAPVIAPATTPPPPATPAKRN